MRGFLRNIDKYCGKIKVFLFSLFKKSHKKDLKFNRILIIKFWAIGDSVISLSLIKALKEKYPDCKIDVLTSKSVKDVYKCGSADNIIRIDSFFTICKLLFQFNKYDLTLDCEPYFNISALFSFYLGKRRIGFADQYRSRLYTDVVKFRKDQHMVQNYLDMLRVVGVDYQTDSLVKLIVSDDVRFKVDNYIKENFSDKKIVGFCTGISGSVKSRMWFEDRFAQLADKIVQELDYQVAFLDSLSNQETVETIRNMMNEDAISTLGKLSLKEVFYFISKCDVFISNDTGLMHIAAAQGCKTIGLFGPNTPVLWAPYGKNNVSIYKTDLLPSIQNDKGVFEDRNREEYMGVISINDVFEKVKRLQN
ncbi:MAG: glycosyltransferase family 9 protein [Bacteroidales bacterium]|nr:glycosyltransferase family 9 protein [Bacteroidales bacterium]MDD4218091.1 glycosyltransferase family 9 protein [Bacteroidales bacterium]MDY0143226.1 glycosyltransferase family 9 protein [Bacteroidales bacterium]